MQHSFWHTPLCLAPRALRPWLTAKGSLTARLIASFGPLQVQIRQQGWQQAHRDEAAALQISGSRQWVRDVLLRAGQQPLVFAHSIARPETLRGSFGFLRRLGERPLGAALFADRRIRREALCWRRIDARHPLWQKAGAASAPLPRQLWARRSVFVRGRDRLLVTEVFLWSTR